MTTKEFENLKPGDKIRKRGSDVDWLVIETFSDDIHTKHQGHYIRCACDSLEEYYKVKSSSVGEHIFKLKHKYLPKYSKIVHYHGFIKSPIKVKVKRLH